MAGMVTKASKSAKYGAVIKRCGCLHDYQDEIYGKGNRVHNLCKLGEEARCTVCAKQHK